MYLLLLFALLYVRAVTKNENTSNGVPARSNERERCTKFTTLLLFF